MMRHVARYWQANVRLIDFKSLGPVKGISDTHDEGSTTTAARRRQNSVLKLA
jgi:hypothetical protein